MSCEQQVYYFGCYLRTGHHLYDRNYNVIHRDKHVPWASQDGWLLDGGLIPDKNAPQGEAFVHRKNGWTVISFWDRSVDSRSGSNSGFIVHGEIPFHEALAKAKESFPAIFERFKFDICLSPRYASEVSQ